ncbi:hypothetical protein OPKNFCMD_1369 [Methylobacterium crusticola]|uniref:N-acetyltransferase domain-containing protein n=1 Tax=Methylobacterium crusticola TaxID=1697972 RepID=A0ABQ4QTJ6_9HYPH|nr:GNAT family N-acetyltransferase [Methylobacterium crusticola]GJD48646.1 hypothetical protein OPKNFCMD_1369 [Methylobacterium crusticola]
MTFTIRPARNEDDLRDAAALMAAYAASLGLDLAYQNFDAELAGLPGAYAPPEGELFLARDQGGSACGCVALRPVAPEGCCEVKRLFIVPAARGRGLGRALVERVVEAAGAKGYREVRLDTLPTMGAAVGLYEEAGFRRIAPYYDPTPPGTIFMGRRLPARSAT